LKGARRHHGLSRDAYRGLLRRYLLWMYKTTKDELDRIDRKFTQLDVDRFIAGYFFKISRRLSKRSREALDPFFREWDEYVEVKEKDAQDLKSVGPGEMEARYAFLHLKLQAVQTAARRYLGPKSVKEFQRLYESKAVERILADTSGRR